MNHRTPVPAPKPLCAIYLPQLSLLVLDQLDATQAQAVRDHLADCEYCQWRLREYAVVREALHRHFGLQPSAPAATGPAGARERRRLGATALPVLTLEKIMRASQQAQDTSSTRTTQLPPRLPERFSQHRRLLTAFGAIAAVLVLAVLAASLFANFGGRKPGPAAKPTPTHDAQAQTYLAVLHTYLRPVLSDIAADHGCQAAEQGRPATQLLSYMLACRAPEAAAVSDAQALATHLTVAPPARWQTADTALKAAVAATISVYTQSLAAIDAHNVSRWNALFPQVTAAWDQYCAPLAQINAGLPLDSTLNLNGASICNG